MNEIKLVDLQDIALPNWLPNQYIQGLADTITKTQFVPPIIILDDELLTPDVVAALITIKARNESKDAVTGFTPAEVAVMGNRWLVKVDRRQSSTVALSMTPINHNTYITVQPDDWYRRVHPPVIWRDAYWGYTNTHSTGGLGGVNAISSWSADSPLLPSYSSADQSILNTPSVS